MVNEIQVEIEAAKQLIAVLRQHGKKLGEKAVEATKDIWENGGTVTARVVLDADEIKNIRIGNFPYKSKVLMKFGSPEVCTVSNGLIIVAGVYTGGRSAVSYRTTQSQTVVSAF